MRNRVMVVALAIPTVVGIAALYLAVGSIAGAGPASPPAAGATTPTPKSPFPMTVVNIANGGSQAAAHLHVSTSAAFADFDPLSRNAPGCPPPSVIPAGFFPWYEVDLTWPTACVEPGESVELSFTSDCPECGPPPQVSSCAWTANQTSQEMPCTISSATPTATPVVPPGPGWADAAVNGWNNLPWLGADNTGVGTALGALTMPGGRSIRALWRFIAASQTWLRNLYFPDGTSSIQINTVNNGETFWALVR